ncbi:MAG: alpha,6-mannosyltransferase [Pseudonocardiales bacterium]|nr:alpha,6-mannosyltransferase [Pseudonocardiales bacterium]
MRVVQLANFYSPTSGGLRVAVDRLGAGYRAQGIDTTLIVPGPATSHRPGLIQLAAPRLPNGSGYRVIVSRRAVLRALAASRPDLIEVHDKVLQHWLWDWSRRHRVPVVAVSHERLDATLGYLLPRVPAGLLARAANRIAGRTAAECDRLVVCSAFAAAEFGGHDPAGRRLRQIALGVDLEQFRPAVHRSERAAQHTATPTGDPARSIRLIAVGRLSAEKRPDLAVSTLAELHRRGVPAELTLLGSGPWEPRLRRQAAGMAVRFAGHLSPSSRVAAAITDCDIALVPGPAETFGLAALESLACGVATVVVRGAGTAEVIDLDRRAGRAVEPDPASFADAVCDLAAADGQKRAAAARALAERFTWARTVESMLAVQAEVGRPASPAPGSAGPGSAGPVTTARARPPAPAIPARCPGSRRSWPASGR